MAQVEHYLSIDLSETYALIKKKIVPELIIIKQILISVAFKNFL